MKPTFARFLFLTVLFLSTASAAKAPSSILGKWEAVAGEEGGKRMALPSSMKVTFDFKKGGKLIQVNEVRGRAPMKLEGSWTLKGKTLTVKIKGREEAMTVSVKGKVLTLGKARGKLIVQRPGSNAVKITAADRQRTKKGLETYQRKVKMIEALEGLDKLKAGARSFFTSDRYDTTGKLLPSRFPPGRTSWTPKVPCCRQSGKKCKPDAKAWDRAPWKLLQFQHGNPHHFQWRYRASGIGRKSKVIIEARGDLDCDGRYSSFKLTGKVDAKSNPVFSKVSKKDPLE